MKYSEAFSRSTLSNINFSNSKGVYEKNQHIVDLLVDQSLNFIERCKSGIRMRTSEYLELPYDIGSFYVRFNKNFKDEKDCFCLSNISLDEDLMSKGIFTAFLVIIHDLLAKQEVITYVENPLEKKFQSFFKKVGAEPDEIANANNGLGNYFLPL